MTSFATPVHVFVSLRPKDPTNAAAVDALQGALATLVAESSKEPGCIYYYWYPEASDPNHYLIVEKYVNQDAVDHHNGTAHFISQVPILQEHADIAFIKYGDEQSTAAAATAVAAPPGAPATRLVVTVTVSDEAKFLSTAAALTEKSRAEEGNLQYDFAKVRGGDEYIYVELWRSDAALDLHSASEHCKELIPVLDACSKVTGVVKAYEKTT